MADILWKDGGSNPVSLITTGLDSLTTTGTATSAALDNTTDLLMFVDLQLHIVYGGGAPTVNTVIDCYIVRSVDGGSTYEDIPPQNGRVGGFVLAATTSAQNLIIPGVLVPPGFWKAHLIARTTGATADSSGNTLTGLFYTEQVV